MERRQNCRFEKTDCEKMLNSINLLQQELEHTQKPLPVISAMIHVFKTADRGKEFKPLLRVSTYAGIDRRRKESSRALHE